MQPHSLTYGPDRKEPRAQESIDAGHLRKFAADEASYKEIIHDLLEAKEEDEGIIVKAGTGAIFSEFTWRVLEDLKKKGIPVSKIFGVSGGAIVSAVRALNYQDPKYRELLLKPKELELLSGIKEIQQYSPYIVAAKMLPFAVDVEVNGVLLSGDKKFTDWMLEHYEDILQRMLAIPDSSFLTKSGISTPALRDVVEEVIRDNRDSFQDTFQDIQGERASNVQVYKLKYNDTIDRSGIKLATIASKRPHREGVLAKLQGLNVFAGYEDHEIDGDTAIIDGVTMSSCLRNWEIRDEDFKLWDVFDGYRTSNTAAKTYPSELDEAGNLKEPNKKVLNITTLNNFRTNRWFRAKSSDNKYFHADYMVAPNYKKLGSFHQPNTAAILATGDEVLGQESNYADYLTFTESDAEFPFVKEHFAQLEEFVELADEDLAQLQSPIRNQDLITQQGRLECGIAIIQMICKQLGHEFSNEEIKDAVNYTDKMDIGTIPKYIHQGLNQLLEREQTDLHGEIETEQTIDQLQQLLEEKEKVFVLIAQSSKHNPHLPEETWEERDHLGLHYVQVLDIDTDSEDPTVTLANPFGGFQQLPLDVFAKQWSLMPGHLSRFMKNIGVKLTGLAKPNTVISIA